MKECDNSTRKINISSKFILSISLLIMFDTLLLRPSLHCNTPLHSATLHHTSLHFTTIHHTSPNYISLHLSTLHFLSFTLHYPLIQLYEFLIQLYTSNSLTFWYHFKEQHKFCVSESPELSFLRLSQLFPPRTTFFRILSNSLFTNRPIIRRYMFNLLTASLNKP